MPQHIQEIILLILTSSSAQRTTENKNKNVINQFLAVSKWHI